MVRNWPWPRGVPLDGQHWRDVLARRPVPGRFQPFGMTLMNRYPEAFSAARDLLGPAPNLLSFGCSTGEEVKSLLLAMPAARVTGVDASRSNLWTARVRLRHEVRGRSVHLLHGVAAPRVPAHTYDAVFAMAVFRHGDLGAEPDRCSQLIRFADVDRVVSGLVATLRIGGLLVVRHANFRVGDMAVAPLLGARMTPGGFEAWASPTPVYDRDDRLVPEADRDDGMYLRLR